MGKGGCSCCPTPVRMAWTEPSCKVATCVCSLIILLASVIMFALSFATLDPHQMGLEYNAVTVKLDPETRNNGRYFLGLGHRFIKFPKKLQYIEFSQSVDGGVLNRAITVWTKDGQEVRLEVGFYYKIQPHNLARLYYRFEEDYGAVIRDLAIEAFREVTTEFDTIDFFERRHAINDAMHAALQEALRDEVFCDVPRFNLLKISVPAKFDDAVIDKVIVEQEAATLGFLQRAEEIRARSRVIVSKSEQQILVDRAAVAANATLIVANATANANQRVSEAKATFLRDLSLKLDFNVSDTILTDPLLQYLYMELLGKQRDLTINTPTALFNV